jgi:hypothetical protein
MVQQLSSDELKAHRVEFPAFPGGTRIRQAIERENQVGQGNRERVVKYRAVDALWGRHHGSTP